MTGSSKQAGARRRHTPTATFPPQSTASALASAAAPFVYFDKPTVWFVRDGIVGITLEAERHTRGEEEPESDYIDVAQLRMSWKAALALAGTLDAITKHVALAQQQAAAGETTDVH